MIDPHMYVSSGLLNAYSFDAREGSALNPRFPAPTIARFSGGNLVADTLMRALAPILCLLYAFGYTLVGYDQVMSLTPTWYSTMFIRSAVSYVTGAHIVKAGFTFGNGNEINWLGNQLPGAQPVSAVTSKSAPRLKQVDRMFMTERAY